MRKFLAATFNFLANWPAFLLPKLLLVRIDPERFGIDDFVSNTIVKELRLEDLLLDAGAGSFRYKKALDFTHYESCDFEDIFHEESRGRHTFTCSLDDIPQPDNKYDVVVNTQVLEHIEFPEKVVSELFRILKPGGKLFLTTNQMWAVHGAPYNFYFYTRYGLRSLFERSGFKVISIKPRGGIFWLLAKVCHSLPAYIFYQNAFTGYKKDIRFKPRFVNSPLSYLFIFLYLIFQPLIGILAPLILFHLDFLDKQKDFTLGYQCYCIKEA